MSNQNLKVPAEIESEIAIIGCIFLDPEVIYQVADVLTPDDFYETKNRLIYRTMLDINKQGRAIDATTVIADLTLKSVLDQAGGVDYIASIADYSYSTANIESYIDLIENASLRRNTINALNTLAQKGYDAKVSAFDYIDDVEKTVFDLSKRRRVEDFKTINAELERFDPQLASRPQIVVANKIDLATDEQLERLRAFIESQGLEFYTMCAPIAEGTREVIQAVAAKLKTLPPIVRYEQEEIPKEIFEKKKNTGFTIRAEQNVYFVEAEWLLKILQRTDLDDYESLQYFQRVLETSGILDALRQKGIQEGDTVSIYDLEFEFVE